MSDQEITKVYLPKSILYPITVLKVHVKKDEKIQKYQRIITYKYYDYEPVPISEVEDEVADESERQLKKVENVGTYDSSVNGVVKNILVKANDEIRDAHQHILEVLEPCAHPIQFGGLCAVCGKVLEEEETGYRAAISMAHQTTNLKVSSKEAENIERSSTDRLLQEKKLSLVVDLDQTVIHVTVDPTIGEWMSDPSNPNYGALKDVKTFALEEPPFIPVNYHGPPIQPIKRWYYVKLRPQLETFLEKMNEKYEMHIYTMATRKYAENIAKIIDPDGIYFGERILSRDESGSLTQKSLERLFPVDTSMVVIIDDRGDVWNWSPNLIKVVPYDFFLGIGDINSSFLPRQQALLGPSKRRKSVSILEEMIINEEDKKMDENAIDDDSEEAQDEDEGEKEPKTKAFTVKGIDGSNSTVSSPIDRLIELTDTPEDPNLLIVQETERTNALEQQEHDRPLKRLQENLDKIIEEESGNITTEGNPTFTSKKTDFAMKHKVEDRETHNLLYDDDKELQYLSQALTRIHNEFYFEFKSEPGQEKLRSLPDVKDIMIEMKSFVFKDCIFLLSGILPLGTKLDHADIVIWAKSFGATFVENYTTSVTHVICKNAGTFKVRLAKSVDENVKVVNPDWLFACMSLWDRIPEDEYTVEVENLLSKSQVDDYLEFHGKNDSSLKKSLDWEEIDNEMKEFMGSDYEDSDEDDDNEEAVGGSLQELEANGENNNGEGDSKADSVNESDEQTSIVHVNDAQNKDIEAVKRKLETDNSTEVEDRKRQHTEEDSISEDEFEKELLEHLADLE